MVNISLTYWGKFKRTPILNDKLLLNMRFNPYFLLEHPQSGEVDM
jgi:hypothetical protein